MGTYETYTTDKGKEEEGAWVTFADGSKWLIARANSKTSRDARQKAEKPYTVLIRANERRNIPLPEDIQDEINMRWSINGLVLGWEGVTGPDKQPLDFTKENVRMVLNDLPDIHLEVLQASADVSNFQSELDEEAEGNLPATSSSS